MQIQWLWLIVWLWLIISFLPYTIERQKASSMQSLILSALFWQFSFTYQKKQYSWSFSLPWIVQIQRSRYLRTIVIKAAMKLVREWVKKIIPL